MSHEQSGTYAYLSSQLIPCLDNKRALLRYMSPVFESLKANRDGFLFLDPSALSPSVQRLALSRGMVVRANSWEPYSECLNRCWIELSSQIAASAFADAGGVEAI
jgi:adenine-specific DNA-methyltransferase